MYKKIEEKVYVWRLPVCKEMNLNPDSVDKTQYLDSMKKCLYSYLEKININKSEKVVPFFDMVLRKNIRKYINENKDVIKTVK